MQYVLNGDYTLIDTQVLKDKMLEHGIEKRTPEVFDTIKKMEPDFDFGSLLYDDARKMLEQHGANCFMVTTFNSRDEAGNDDAVANEAFQWRKLEEVGIFSYIPKARVRVVGGSKASAYAEFKKLIDDMGETGIVIDDQTTYLKQAIAAGFGIDEVRQMYRKGGGSLESPENVSEFAGITSFNEFLEDDEE